ncbi:fatty acid desaturase 6-like [Babylonia areolata]|uniref:fatty acid desaturase 6-like n=1 Tax=Babylonia areolata TaxID=304850 RepID=UPI003FD3C2D4
MERAGTESPKPRHSARTSKTASLAEYDVSTSKIDEHISKQREDDGDVFHEVQLDQLPCYADLKKQVDDELVRMTWWEAYGIDNFSLALAVLGAVMSFFIMKSDSFPICCLGVFLLGCCHSTLAVKGNHLTSHRAVVQSAPINRLLGYFFSDICGTFPTEASHELHVKQHHAYTNILGIGDSSTWKVPMVPPYLYMFVTPLLVPAITPLVAIGSLWGQWSALCRFLMLACFGLWANFTLFMQVSGFSFLQALVMTVISRGVLSIPYIHVNVFQHIGLPMYDLKDRPKKIYQMSSGVLNLNRNLLLDHCFGHSIISAHIEHHLFPRLSDQQCLRVKPLVRRFLHENGMAYNEANYSERVHVFLSKYRELMVYAPPISHFVGIQ